MVQYLVVGLVEVSQELEQMELWRLVNILISTIQIQQLLIMIIVLQVMEIH